MFLHPARELWLRYEPIHAVTYFAPESHQAARDAGLKGFWMGYFGFRAAPMGAVSSGVVIATFANFAPQMVRRAIPDAWSFASPEVLVAVRSEAAARALRRRRSRRRRSRRDRHAPARTGSGGRRSDESASVRRQRRARATPGSGVAPVAVVHVAPRAPRRHARHDSGLRRSVGTRSTATHGGRARLLR